MLLWRQEEQLEAVLEEKDIQGVYCHISMFDKKQLWKEAFETMYQVHKRGKIILPGIAVYVKRWTADGYGTGIFENGRAV